MCFSCGCSKLIDDVDGENVLAPDAPIENVIAEEQDDQANSIEETIRAYQKLYRRTKQLGRELALLSEEATSRSLR